MTAEIFVPGLPLHAPGRRDGLSAVTCRDIDDPAAVIYLRPIQHRFSCQVQPRIYRRYPMVPSLSGMLPLFLYSLLIGDRIECHISAPW